MDTATINTLVELVLDLDRAGIRELVPEGDRLRYRPRAALTLDLAERLKAHKGDLLAVLRPGGALGDGDLGAGHRATTVRESRPEPDDRLIRWEDCIAPPDPCAGCGGIMFWWNARGDRRCLRCNPPKAAIRLLEKTERIRRRSGIPSPAGAAEMLAEIKSWTDT